MRRLVVMLLVPVLLALVFPAAALADGPIQAGDLGSASQWAPTLTIDIDQVQNDQVAELQFDGKPLSRVDQDLLPGTWAPWPMNRYVPRMMIPADAAPGVHSVRLVDTGGVLLAHGFITVEPSGLKLTSLSPTYGGILPGQRVMLNGEHLPRTIAEVRVDGIAVKVDGLQGGTTTLLAGDWAASDNGAIEFVLPETAKTGFDLTVALLDGESATLRATMDPPIIDWARVGDRRLRLNGRGLYHPTVSVDGTLVDLVTASDYLIEPWIFTLPNDLTQGNHTARITTPYGETSVTFRAAGTLDTAPSTPTRTSDPMPKPERAPSTDGTAPAPDAQPSSRVASTSPMPTAVEGGSTAGSARPPDRALQIPPVTHRHSVADSLLALLMLLFGLLVWRWVRWRSRTERARMADLEQRLVEAEAALAGERRASAQGDLGTQGPK